jgi:hypothetical protein
MKNQKSMPAERTNVQPQGAPASDTLPPCDERHSLLSRVDEYEALGLANPEPFGALMAAVQANLFRAAGDSEAAAMRALASHAGAHSLSVLEPDIKRHLDIVRRIARNAQLEIGALE